VCQQYAESIFLSAFCHYLSVSQCCWCTIIIIIIIIIKKNNNNSNNNRDDSKRPDDSTLIPWPAGKSLAWDITVVNMVAESYISISASPGGAAEHAAARKSAKYSSLPSSHIFQPLALETLRPINTTGITFSELGRRLTDVSGDPRETLYLFQRVSLAVQRYNSVAFRGIFSVPTELD